MESHFMYSLTFSKSIFSTRAPFSANKKSPNFIEILFLSTFSPDLPIHIITLPQLGSSPATAVFTSGEQATEKAIFFALVTDLAFKTFIVKNFFAPSPSTTTCLARFKHTFLKTFQIFELLDLIPLLCPIFIFLLRKLRPYR